MMNREQARRMIGEDYSRSAKLYEKLVVPIHAPVARRLVELAALEGGERVLDVGTGTGLAALIAAERVGKTGSVLGIDMARGMLKIAKRKVARLGLQNVKFRRMNTASLQLPSGYFDVVISSCGTPELPSDVRPFLSEVYRLLKANGRFSFCEWQHEHKASNIVREAFERYKVTNPARRLAERRELEAIIEDERKHYVRLYYTDPSKVKSLIERARFRNVRVIADTFNVTYPSAEEFLDFFLSQEYAEYSAIPSQIREDFRREALKALSVLETPKGLSWKRKLNFYLANKRDSALTSDGQSAVVHQTE